MQNITNDAKIEREKRFHNDRYSDDQGVQQTGKFYSITGLINRSYKKTKLLV